MKNFRDYLSESEEAADNPVVGDTFAINIREECLIESVVVESRRDGVVIAADQHMMQLLESYGYSFEQTCMECGGSGCGCGQSADEYGDETDVGQDPGEYDYEGDMAKDELMTMIRSARKLIGMLDNDDNMPEWTQKKINKATDYVDTASDYISSKKERGVMEGDSESNPVARATLHRIMMRHPGMLAQHGPEKVMAAVDDVADLVGDMDDIGTSDISGWVNMVQEILDSQDQGVAEGSLHEDLQADDGEHYRSADDFFGQFEADHFDDTQESEDGMEIRGYIDGVNVMAWRYDSPRKTSGYGKYDDSGLGEAGVAEGSLKEAAVDREGPADLLAAVEEEMNNPGRHIDNLTDVMNATFGSDRSPEFNHARKAIAQYLEFVTNADVDHPSDDPDDDAPMISAMTHGDISRHIQEYDLTDYLADAAGELYQIVGMNEAEYQGRKVPLGKPMQGDVAKSKVYVRDPKTGNIKKVNFGDPNMKIKKSNPARRKSFRARHNCDNPGPRTKARYWSCRAW